MSFVSEGVYISAPSSLVYVSQVQHPRRVLTGLTNHCFPQSTAFIPNYFKPLILQTIYHSVFMLAALFLGLPTLAHHLWLGQWCQAISVEWGHFRGISHGTSGHQGLWLWQTFSEVKDPLHYTHTHTHTHTHTYIYMCVCVYIYIYTYIFPPSGVNSWVVSSKILHLLNHNDYGLSVFSLGSSFVCSF